MAPSRCCAHQATTEQGATGKLQVTMTIYSQKKRGRRNRSRHCGRAMLVVILLIMLWSCSMLSQQDPTVFEESRSRGSTEQRVLMVTYIFGTSASYVRLFVESARHSGIDVAIVGSPAPAFPLPPNVLHVPMSWEQFVERVSARLFEGEKLSNLLNASRNKVIDFKPCFAHLFPELVSRYDWWGHLDNDLLLGNIRHFVTQDILSHYDLIPGIPPKGKWIMSWGPFTLYRNTKVTNELFRLASHSFKELYDKKDPLYIDEWGDTFPGRSTYWNSTMSGILTNHYERLGIRVWRNGFPLVWDGSCKRREERCAECTLDLYPNAHERLTTRSARENCTLDQECQQEQVLLCHYQRSKHRLEASLGTNSQKTMELIKDGRLRVSYMEGFSSFPI